MASSNRFDTSQQQNYVSGYTPLPFQQIMALGEKTNQKFQAGQAAEAELGALGQAIKSAPMYEDSRASFINEYNGKTKALVDKYHGNYGDPNFQLDVRRLTNEFKSRPEINAFNNTLKTYNDWETTVKNPDNEMNLDFTYDMDPNNPNNFRQRDVVKEGVYNPTFTKYEDYTERAKKVLGDVKDSGYVKEMGLDFSKPVRINNGETEVYSNRKHGYVGLSEGRLGELAELVSGNYAQSVAGKHHLQSILGTNITYKDLNKLAATGDKNAIQTLQLVNKEFTDHVFRSNANQIGGKSTDEVSYMNATNRKAQGDNDSSNFGRIITTNEQGNPEATDINSVLDGLGLKDTYDDKGGLKVSSGIDSKYTATKLNGETQIFNNSVDAHKFAGSTGVISQQREDSNKSANDIVNGAYAKFVPLAKKLGIEVKDGKYADAVYKYALNIAKQRSTTSNLQPNTSENMTEYFLGNNSNIHNMEVYEQGNESSNAKLTNEMVGSMAKNSKITGVDYFGNNQAGWKIAVTPKDDKGHPAGVDNALIAIPRDKKFEEETRPIYTISKGVLEFAKTGNVDPKYKDGNYNKVQDYAKQYLGGKPTIAGSSTEYIQDKDGNTQEIVRGSFSQVVNGEPKFYTIEFNPNYVTPIINTLDNTQNAKTEELQLRGSLNQHINKLQGKTDPNKTQ